MKAKNLRKNPIPTVSVCIPAYNEGKNIKKLIHQILAQNTAGWILKEILVISDGSSDNTVREAKAISDKRIMIYEDHVRRGKSFRLNEFFKKAAGDIIVLLDADTKFGNSSVIKELVQKFSENEKIMLSAANARPHSPKTFFEKSLYSSLSVYYDSRELLNEGDNIYACTGACMAVRKEFARLVKIPKIIIDDSYIYLLCKSKGYSFGYAKNALVYYRLPTTLRDYVKQTFRSTPEAVKEDQYKIFGKLVDEEFSRPLSFYIKSMLRSFSSNPIGFAYIAIVKTLCKPFYPLILKKYKLSWNSIASTKS